MAQTKKQFFPLCKGNLLRLLRSQAYYLPKNDVGEAIIPMGTIVMFLRRIPCGRVGGESTYWFEMLYDGKTVWIYHNGGEKPYRLYENIRI